MRNIAAAAIIASLAWTSQAFAVEGCPAGKEGKSPLTAPTADTGTAFENVIQTLDLSHESAMLKDHVLRIRTVTVSPGGIIPLHSHEDRPAMFFMKNGSLTLIRQDCTVPQVLHEGDVTREGKDTVHWARNDGKEFAILLVTDVVHVKDMDKKMPM